jgi:hypothetical protein
MAQFSPRLDADGRQFSKGTTYDLGPTFIEDRLASLHVPFPSAHIGAMDNAGQPLALQASLSSACLRSRLEMAMANCAAI